MWPPSYYVILLIVTRGGCKLKFKSSKSVFDELSWNYKQSQNSESNLLFSEESSSRHRIKLNRIELEIILQSVFVLVFHPIAGTTIFFLLILTRQYKCYECIIFFLYIFVGFVSSKVDDSIGIQQHFVSLFVVPIHIQNVACGWRIFSCKYRISNDFFSFADLQTLRIGHRSHGFAYLNSACQINRRSRINFASTAIVLKCN